MERKGSLKWLWASLLIIALIIFGIPSLLILRYGGLGIFTLIPLLIMGLIVLGLVKVFKNKKDYKEDKYNQPMKIQTIFYIVGVIFIFAAVWYFAREYIAQFPNSIKLILLVVSTIVTFIIAEFMRGADK